MRQKKAPLQFLLLCAAAALALVLLVSSLSAWISLSREKNALVAQVEAMTARKEAIIEANNRLETPRSHLKTIVKDLNLKLPDIEDTPSQLKKITKLREEIAAVEQQLSEAEKRLESLPPVPEDPD